jgi:hypothetical protein
MTRYAHATYCDDIRQEIGGKITLVGIYSGALCLSLCISASRSAPIRSLVVVGAYAGNEVINITLDSSQIDEIMAANAEQASDDTKQMMLMLMAALSPFIVSVPGKLTLTVTADGEDVYCGGLRISTAPDGTVFGR